MEFIIMLIIYVGIPAFFLMLWGLIGAAIEKRHYRSIREREQASLSLPVLTISKAITEHEDISESKMVMGSVVVSIDYFKRFYATLINIFGGSVKPYETLLDRGRREALLRMKYKARGFNYITNLRIVTSTIGNNANDKKENRSIGSIEVLAFGTAVKTR